MPLLSFDDALCSCLEAEGQCDCDGETRKRNAQGGTTVNSGDVSDKTPGFIFLRSLLNNHQPPTLNPHHGIFVD